MYYIGKVGIDGRMWNIHAIFTPTGIIELIKMTWGVAKREFAPGTEYDDTTRAGAGVVSAVLALADSELLAEPETDDYAVIERW